MPDEFYPRTDFARLADELEARRADLDPTIAPPLRALQEQADARCAAERAAEKCREAEARELDREAGDALRALFAFGTSPEAARIAQATGENEFLLPLAAASDRDTIHLVVGEKPHIRVWHGGGGPYWNVNWTIEDAVELAHKTSADVRRALVGAVRSGAVWAAVAREARATEIEQTLLARFGRSHA